MAKLNQITDQLFKRMLEVKTEGESRAVFLNADDGLPTQLALDTANELGSYENMKNVAQDLYERIIDYRNRGNHEMFYRIKTDLRELEAAWDGINGWKC